jgi:DNA-binding transcriptional regulator/RsmH inhibitor MraZ
MPEDGQGLVEYTGNYEHGVDGSFRVMVPSPWRPEDKEMVFSMVPWPIQQPSHIRVMPPERWRLMLKRIRENNLLSGDEISTVERRIAATTVKKRIDDVGRLCVGEKLAEQFGITAKAMLVGGLDKFEIWEPARFAATDGDVLQLPSKPLGDLRL